MTAKKIVKKLPIFDKVVLYLNIIIALALLLSYLAPTTSPLDFITIALLGFGYLILVLANLVFVVYWLVRKRILMLISLISILLGFNTINSYYQFNSNKNVDKNAFADGLRILHYNVREFKGIDKFAEEPTENEIIDLVKDKQPDIINMVEFDKRKVKKDSVTNALMEVVKSKYYFFRSFKGSRNDSIGNAIFSKYPIVNSGTIDTNQLLGTKAIFADVKYKNKTIRIYCIHLAPVVIKKEEKGRYLKGNVGFDKFFLIEGKVSAAFVARTYQVNKIKTHLQNCPYPYIITGDFNDTPISYAVNVIGDGLKNAFAEKGSGFQTTYYSGFPLQIDYIFASPQFDVLSYQAPDKKISDHKPIISDLKLK